MENVDVVNTVKPNNVSTTSSFTTSILDKLREIFIDKAPTILEAAAIIVVSVFLALFIRQLMRKNLKMRIPGHVYKPLETAIFYLIVILGVVIALSPFGISLSGLILAGGFAGIVIGFAAQQSLSNLMSGIFLLVEQPLRIGDPIQVADVSGVVHDISFLSTRIRTWDGQIVRIPNNTVFNEVITNYIRTKARRVDIKIGVHYKSDLDKAINVIKELLDNHPYCLANPAPEVFVEEYSDSAIVLRARCWAPPPVWFTTKIEIQTKLKKVLDEAGVVIPYPQLDLHLVSSTADISVKIQDRKEK